MTIKIEAGTGEGKNETEQKPGKTAARGEEGKGREKELVDWRKGERESGCIAKRGGERENVESRATHARHAISLSLPPEREIPSFPPRKKRTISKRIPSVSSIRMISKKKKEGISRRKKRRRRRKRALSIPFLSKKTLYVRFEKYPSSSVSFREEQRYNAYKPRLI